jgi:hypothetical protein
MPVNASEDRAIRELSRGPCRGPLGRFALAAALVALAAGTAPTADELAARRDKISQMDPIQRQELLRRHERFRQLSPEVQGRLRDLQAQISADADSERLHQILERYHEWLKTITPSERATLAELRPEKRVEQIAHIQRRQQTAQRLEHLERQDTREIMRWIYDLVKKHRDDVIADMDEPDRKRFEKQDESTQRRWLIYRIFGGRRGGQPESRVTPQDIERLAARLSEGARAELSGEDSPEAQQRLVGMWIFGTLYRSASWRGDRRVNPLIGEELLEFLQNEVPPAYREQLLKKPRDEMLRELRRMYFEHGQGEDRLGPTRPPFDRRRKSGRPKGPRPGDTPPADESPPAF